MALDEKELLRMKKEVDDSRQKLSELKGQKDFLLKDLKEKWGCSSIAEAKKKVEALQKEVDDLDARIRKGTDELEREYQLL